MGERENGNQCTVALKEWALTCRALRDGLQVVLLRKGGLLDEDGVFHLEHRAFWLQPTFLHQDETLVKPEFRGLLREVQEGREAGENRRFFKFDLWAEVTDTFALGPDDEARLKAVSHIWSNAYLDLRFSYKPDNPLLCAVLRVYERKEPHVVAVREEDMGCRSWIELAEGLDCGGMRPVLGDGEFGVLRGAVEQILNEAGNL